MAEIVATAIRLIERDGLDALSPSSIARELGVARTVVYHHVGDRDGVLAAVGDLVMAPLFEIRDRLVAEIDDDAERLRAYYRAELELLATTPVPIERIVANRVLDTNHERLWVSLAELESTLVGWLTAATSCAAADARVRVAAATAMTLGLRTLWASTLEADAERVHRLQLAVLGL